MIEIPKVKPEIFKFNQENLPGIVFANSALKNPELKGIFVWHLSIIINFKNIIENGMPSREEREVVDQFGDELERCICGSKEKFNALFLARVTWNSTREILFRVYDPELADEYLQGVISNGNYPRDFDYRLEEDFEWKKAEFYLGRST